MMKMTHWQLMKNSLCGITIALAVMTVHGCAHYTDYSAFIAQPRPLVTTTSYRIAPPDVIQISSKRVREMDGHSEAVRPDGIITPPLLGPIFVAGQTCEEISAQLEQLAKDFYQDADVTVRVIGFNSKKIFVFGEVASPGAKPYDGANTVLETLAQAQPTRLADPGRIHVLRPSENGDLVRRMTIDLNRMVKTGDTTLNAVLEEGDIVYVPANALATVGLTLQQLLLPIQPAAATVAGPENIDSSVAAGPYN